MKPILFLDFDRTLFDTERYYLWLGEPRKENNQALIDGARPLPDFSQFLFPDAQDFLTTAKEKYTIVILSFVKLDYSPQQPMLQMEKIRGSGVSDYAADIIVTIDNKGKEAKHYLNEHSRMDESFVFVDDEPAHLSSMQAQNPNAVCVHLDRGGASTGILIASAIDTFVPMYVARDLVEVTELIAKQ